MTPGYIPTEEELEEATQTIMALHAWMLGLPDPRERIPLPATEPQPHDQDAHKAAAAPPTKTPRHPRG